MAGALLAVTFAFGGVGSANAAQCLQDAYGDQLNCTTEDVDIASIDITDVTEPCTAPGDTFTFDAIIHVAANATSRYDSPDDDAFLPFLPTSPHYLRSEP